MNAQNARMLVAAADAIATDVPVDWAALQAALCGERECRVLRQLRILSILVDFHRRIQQ